MTGKIKLFYANAKKRIRAHGDEMGYKYQPVKIVRTRDCIEYHDALGNLHLLDLIELKAARNAVKRGAALLDAKLPGWESILQLDQLRLADCEMCVCGQLAWATKTPEWKAIWQEYLGRTYNTEDGFGPMLKYLGIDGGEFNDYQASRYGFDKGFDHGLRTEYSYEALEVEWHRLVSRRLRTGRVSARA